MVVLCKRGARSGGSVVGGVEHLLAPQASQFQSKNLILNHKDFWPKNIANYFFSLNFLDTQDE